MFIVNMKRLRNIQDIVIFCWVLLAFIQIGSTAPTTAGKRAKTLNPLSVVNLNGTQVTSVNEYGITTIGSIHIEEDVSISEKLKGEKEQKSREDDSLVGATKILSQDKQQITKKHLPKQNLKKVRDKSSKLSSKDGHNSLGAAIELHNQQLTSSDPVTITTSTLSTLKKDENMKMMTMTTTMVTTDAIHHIQNPNGIVSKDVNTISSQLSDGRGENFTEMGTTQPSSSSQQGSSLGTTTIVKDQYLQQTTKSQNDGSNSNLKITTTTPAHTNDTILNDGRIDSSSSDGSGGSSHDSITSTYFTDVSPSYLPSATTDGSSAIGSRDDLTENHDILDHLVVKTTTATTTPDYKISKSEDFDKTTTKYSSEGLIEIPSNDDYKNTKDDENADLGSFDNANKDTSSVIVDEIVDIPTMTTFSPLVTPLQERNEKGKSESGEAGKIVKSIDVDKIDLKSMKNYQGQISSMEKRGDEDSENTEVERTIFGNYKKKVGGVVMGHDGVKVTRKKQLLEKNFKDDDAMMKKHKTLDMINNEELDDMTEKVTDKTKGVEETKKRLTDDNTGSDNKDIKEDSVQIGHNVKNDEDINQKKVENHFDPIIMQEKTVVEHEEIGNVISEGAQKFVTEMNISEEKSAESDSDKFKVEHIPADFDVLDIETTVKKMRTNEKLKYSENSNFSMNRSSTKSKDEKVSESITEKIEIDSKEHTEKVTTAETPVLTESYSQLQKDSQEKVVSSETFGIPPKQEITTFMSNNEPEIVDRTDATEPQVVTEKSLVPSSFTNENKDVEILDIEISPVEMVTAPDIETVTTTSAAFISKEFVESFMKMFPKPFEEDIQQSNNEKTSTSGSLLSSTDSEKNPKTESPVISSSIVKVSAPKTSNQTEEHVMKFSEAFTKGEPQLKSQETTTITESKMLEYNVNDKTTESSSKYPEENKNNDNKKPTDIPGIEIQINVSEGRGDGRLNPSHMLEFSFRKNELKDISLSGTRIQNDSLSSQFRSLTHEEIGLQKASNADLITLKPADIIQNENEFLNESDILVVEITDSGNGTDESSASKENERFSDENPKFTIHNDRASDYDSSNSGKSFPDYEGGENLRKSSSDRESGSEDDDLFIPDLKLEPLDDSFNPITISSNLNKPYPKETSIDRDSDTIFYISNTEVKVVESIPTSNTIAGNQLADSNPLSGRTVNSTSTSYSESHHRRPSQLESQFFPSIYEEDVIIDFPNRNATNDGRTTVNKLDRYEEDIILSPLKNNFDPLKIIRNRNEARTASNDDGSALTDGKSEDSRSGSAGGDSYMGESFIEVEESANTAEPLKNHGGNAFSTPLNGKEHQNYRTRTTSTSDVVVSDVIIQPAVIPEMSIGVPVIGELPPQIQLKEIDYVSKGRDFSSGIGGGGDDGIQYGGGLIASNMGGAGGVGVGYDIDSGYGFVSGKMHSGGNGFGVGGVNDGDNDVTVTSQIVMHAVDNLQKDQLMAEVPSEGATGIKDASALKMENNSTMPERLGNATAYSVLEDGESEFNFTDVQTLFLACFTTLIPLILLAVMGYVVRFLWIKYARHGSRDGSLIGDNSTDPLAAKSLNLSQNEDISRDARETKMHYTPSEKDGVFVVEVARGADSKGIPSSPRNEGECRPKTCTIDIETTETPESTNHEEVQIHQPPSDGNCDEDVIAEDDDMNPSPRPVCGNGLGNSNTGLSQSDLSTSSGDSNKGYTYGNQQLYEINGGYEEPTPKPNLLPSPPVPPTTNIKCENNHCPNENGKCDPETKPIIKAALLKQDTVIEVTNSVKSPKMNDREMENGENETKPMILSKIDVDDKLHQDKQHQLGNGEISSLDNGQTNETENGFDSIISLPAPPSTEEIKQLNDVILMENTQLDSLPPPPPPEGTVNNSSQNHDITVTYDGHGHSTEEQNGVAVVAVSGSS